MKKAIIILLISGLFSGFASAQNLLGIYKNGPVRLIPEKSYGANNNWESLFNFYYNAPARGEGREEDKKIVIAPDGSVFMSHKNRHEIWKFGPDGTFLKKFGTRGGKEDEFPMLPTVQPVVDGKYVFTNDANSRLKFFDLDGNYFKSITLNYMTGSFQPLANGDILLEGKVLLKNQVTGADQFNYKWRHMIVSLNIYSGKGKTLYEYVEDMGSRRLLASKPDSIWAVPPPPAGSKIYLPPAMEFRKPVFTLFSDGQFITSNRQDGKINLYDKSGKEKFSFKLDIKPVAVTEQDAQENYETTRKMILKAIEEAKAKTDIAKDTVIGNKVVMQQSYPDKKEFISMSEKSLTRLDRLKKIEAYFPYLPYFSNIIVDDEGNLLVFEFTGRDEKQSNIFNVVAYDKNGQKLARTSFVCDDYDLSFAESTFVISKGYVYAVAKLKNTTGMPLRLVKFKISN